MGMKILPRKNISSEKDAIPGSGLQPTRVCMHVRGCFRTDARVRREASSLVQEGFSVTVVDVEHERPATLVENLDGIYVRHLVKPHWFVSAHFPWRLLKSAEKFFFCVIALLKVPADIYHAHDVNALLACYAAAKLRRKQLVFDAHELPLYELDHSRQSWLRMLLWRFLARILAGCAGIITVSPPIAQEICARYAVSNVSVVRNIPAYQTATQSNRLHQYLRLNSTIRIALYQGNLQKDRGLDRLVCAARFLDPGYVIVLMGKAAGDTQAELDALIASEGVADRVKILPAVPHEELLDWTASADVGLIIFDPAYSFNIQMCLPNKLFEYLMAGLPVLATPLDAVADLLRIYHAGQIVSSLAPEKIAEAIHAILADSIAYAQLRHSALEAVQKDLSWEKERQKLISLYQSISLPETDLLAKTTVHSHFRSI